ncbi:hypothetical protein EW146_g10138 [Bondarzewia mesenterica]|uniref:MYND-type domain-containing protein n=1 Tax=Bondarzewia mesenterica TaxID=1095465 RepID=A0A4S4L026_9AGAM|nr:hypothetical protein EW146_g10138 [Bondarzewia mesenterica]
MHLHYHSCEVCNYSVPIRKHGEKGLKMCPCREAFYCGPEHQGLHWKIHKSICYNRKHKDPPTANDAAVGYLLQFHDTAIVEIAISALLKENIDTDFRRELDSKAIVISIEQREGMEDMAVAHGAGRIPPFKISREVGVVLLEEEARRQGSEYPFFEHPSDRQIRIERGCLGVALIFQPSGRAITKRVPSIQLSVWEMIREKERTTTNPPMLYWHIGMTNGRINMEVMEEAKKKDREEK